MPTSNPRLKVTLTTEQHELLRRLARQQGTSMSAILVDLFDTAAPVLRRVAEIVDAANQSQEAIKGDLLRSLESAEQSILPMLTGAVKAFDEVERTAYRGAQKSAAAARGGSRARGGARAAAAVEEPPPSNTGVRSSIRTTKRARRHAV